MKDVVTDDYMYQVPDAKGLQMVGKAFCLFIQYTLPLKLAFWKQCFVLLNAHRLGSHGEIVNERGRTMFEVGFAWAIRKVLGD